MRKLWILYSLLFCTLSFSQTPNLTVTGPTSTSGPVIITIQVNAPGPSCSVNVTPQTASVLVSTTQQFTATTLNCTPSTVTWSVNGVNGGDATHGTVSGSGLYTAPSSVPSPATVTVKATSNADVTKSASASVTITTNTSTLDDLYCGPGDVPSFPASDNGVPGPTTCFNTDPANTPSPGVVRTITQATWSTVWAATQCGDIIEQAAGTTIIGNFTLPAKSCDAQHYITYRTSGYLNFPVYSSHHVSPCYWGVASLPGGYPNFNPLGAYDCVTVNGATIQGSTTAPVIVYPTGMSSLRWIGIKFQKASGGFNARIIQHETTGLLRIIYDRVWFDGVVGENTTRVLDFDGGSKIAIVDSFASELHCDGGACNQSQSFIGGLNGLNNVQDFDWKIVNNFMSSAGNTTMGYGGGSANTTPKNGEFRRNWGWKLPSWNPGDPTYAGKAWQVINCWETKNSDTVFVEANVWDWNWVGANQNGSCILLTPKNQSSGSNNICPNCYVKNIIIRYNKMRHINYPIQTANAASDAGGYANGGNTYISHDNEYMDIGYSTCFHCGTNNGNAAQGGMTSGQNGIPSADILNTVSEIHDTYVFASTAQGCTKGGTLGFSGPVTPTMFGLTWKNNLILEQNVGVNNPGDGCSASPKVNCACTPPGTSGTIINTLNACWGSSGWTLTNNAFVRHQSGNVWPGTNCTSEATQTSIFVNYVLGDGSSGEDYHVKPSSPCFNSGDDGKSPGADIDKVNAMTAGVDTF